MKNQTVVCRFNGVDTQLVDEIAGVAGASATSVSQSHPATLDKKGIRVVTVVSYECESPAIAKHLAGKFAPITGVEVFIS